MPAGLRAHGGQTYKPTGIRPKGKYPYKSPTKREKLSRAEINRRITRGLNDPSFARLPRAQQEYHVTNNERVEYWADPGDYRSLADWVKWASKTPVARPDYKFFVENSRRTRPKTTYGFVQDRHGNWYKDVALHNKYKKQGWRGF